jgi:secreted trypsin-like serine protease
VVRALLAAALACAALLALAPPSGAVIGGRPAADGEAPWMVALIDPESRRRPVAGQFCGGALIGPRTVLTAGHCLVFGPRPLLTRARVLPERSARRRELIEVAERVVHPGYRPQFDEENELGDPNDLALLRLEERQPGPYLRVVSRTDGAAWDAGARLRVFGWGNRSRSGPNLPRQLHQGEIERFSDQACDDRYGRGFDSESMFCAGTPDGSVDTCSGDSGGPVVARDAVGRDLLVGIVSFGHECGLAEFPGVYTRVARYERWLASRPRPRRGGGSSSSSSASG